jgi:hypothetical protein
VAAPDTLPPLPVFGQGNSVQLSVRLLDHEGAQQAPAGVSLFVLPPGDTVGRPHATFIAGNQCVGIVELHTPGLWWYRFEKTTEPAAVYEGAFVVEARSVPPPA